MASGGSLSLTMALLLVTSVAHGRFSRGLGEAEVTVAEGPGMPDPFSLRCREKVGVDCGVELFDVLWGTTHKLSEQCCLKIVRAGKPCYNAIVAAEIDAISDGDKAKLRELEARGIKIWEGCAYRRSLRETMVNALSMQFTSFSLISFSNL